MAFTILQGTVLKSLIAFEFQLAKLAKEAKYAKKQNGVVVATIKGSTLAYRKTETGQSKPGGTCPISRTVMVTAGEDQTVMVSFHDEVSVIGGVQMMYPFIAGANDQILNFLIHGTIPYQGL